MPDQDGCSAPIKVLQKSETQRARKRRFMGGVREGEVVRGSPAEWRSSLGAALGREAGRADAGKELSVGPDDDPDDGEAENYEKNPTGFCLRAVAELSEHEGRICPLVRCATVEIIFRSRAGKEPRLSARSENSDGRLWSLG